MKLKKAYVEITNRCNKSCEFCKSAELAARTPSRTLGDLPSPSFMSVANFSTVLAKLKPYTDYVYLHVLGEPLLHPQLPELLETCASHSIHASITTNGTLLTAVHDLSDALLSSPALRQINFSLHSLPSFRATGCDMLKSILRFADAASQVQNSKYIVLRFWLINEDTLIALTEIEKYFAMPPGTLRLLATKDRPHPPGNGIKIAHNVFVQFDVPFTWPDSRDTNIPERRIFTHGKCYALSSQIAVLVDGTVVPCCLDWQGAMRLGNIFENSLSEIFSSDRAQNIRNAFSQRRVIEDFCLTCGFGARLNRPKL